MNDRSSPVTEAMVEAGAKAAAEAAEFCWDNCAQEQWRRDMRAGLEAALRVSDGAATASDVDPAAFAVLREIEIPWLSEELSRAIANLGYPVGCGVPPHPEQIEKAATALFERYAKMVEMARHASGLAQPTAGLSDEWCDAFLKATGEWIEAHEPEMECGVPMECEITQEFADELNADARKQIRKGYAAALSISSTTRETPGGTNEG